MATPKNARYYGVHMVSRGPSAGTLQDLYKSTNGSGKKFYVMGGKRKYILPKGKAAHCAKYPGDKDCPASQMAKEFLGEGQGQSAAGEYKGRTGSTSEAVRKRGLQRRRARGKAMGRVEKEYRVTGGLRRPKMRPK